MSRAILELQKDRFFEALTAKYWNSSAKSNVCPNNDENEGITLESLGGVFIATLFGLALAMITLVIEVFYYRRKDALENAVQSITVVAPIVDNAASITPPPSYDADQRKKKNFFQRNKNGNTITLGGEKFVPSSQRAPPYAPVYSRRSIHSANENEYIE